jgi:hypothetical protein
MIIVAVVSNINLPTNSFRLTKDKRVYHSFIHEYAKTRLYIQTKSAKHCAVLNGR